MQAATVKKTKNKVDMKTKIDLMISMKSLREKRSHLGYLPNDSQLSQFSSQDYFMDIEVANFCNIDESSPFRERGKVVSVPMVRNWILSGKLNGTKPNYYWYVSKEELLSLFSLYR